MTHGTGVECDILRLNNITGGIVISVTDYITHEKDTKMANNYTTRKITIIQGKTPTSYLIFEDEDIYEIISLFNKETQLKMQSVIDTYDDETYELFEQLFDPAFILHHLREKSGTYNAVVLEWFSYCDKPRPYEHAVGVIYAFINSEEDIQIESCSGEHIISSLLQ